MVRAVLGTVLVGMVLVAGCASWAQGPAQGEVLFERTVVVGGWEVYVRDASWVWVGRAVGIRHAEVHVAVRNASAAAPLEVALRTDTGEYPPRPLGPFSLPSTQSDPWESDLVDFPLPRGALAIGELTFEPPAGRRAVALVFRSGSDRAELPLQDTKEGDVVPSHDPSPAQVQVGRPHALPSGLAMTVASAVWNPPEWCKPDATYPLLGLDLRFENSHAEALDIAPLELRATDGSGRWFVASTSMAVLPGETRQAGFCLSGHGGDVPFGTGPTDVYFAWGHEDPGVRFAAGAPSAGPGRHA